MTPPLSDAARYLAAAEKVIATYDAIGRHRALSDTESATLERAIKRADYWRGLVGAKA